MKVGTKEARLTNYSLKKFNAIGPRPFVGKYLFKNVTIKRTSSGRPH